MSILERLKEKLANPSQGNLEAISQPMLDRIGERVSGGKGGATVQTVWCRAQWGSACDKVNVAKSEL